jgi:transcriptional regulator with XRE-family HTH domain
MVADYATIYSMSKTISPLAAYRELTGKSLEDLATPLGVNKTTILRWESGEIPIPIKRLTELETLTGIPRGKLRPDLMAMMGAKG